MEERLFNELLDEALFSNLQKITCIILRNLFGLYFFLISHVPPAHSFFENRSILENILLI